MQLNSKMEPLKELIDGLSKHCPGKLNEKIHKLIHYYEDRLTRSEKFLSHGNKQLHSIIEQKKQNEQILEQQAKMAAMGEMMDAVAHQWKQPLNALSMYSDLLKSDFNDALVDEKYVENFTNDIQEQIEHMVNTLTEFRNFFRPSKAAQLFGIKRSVVSVTLLVKDEFLRNNINISIDSDQEILINAIENEFKHIILNIINNAKDAFNENKTENRQIHISFKEDAFYVYLNIQDNAGGIPLHVINDIFKPNVTTKADGKGTGIGLYMSAQIAHKLGGKLSVANENGGANFLLQITKQEH